LTERIAVLFGARDGKNILIKHPRPFERIALLYSTGDGKKTCYNIQYRGMKE
jgi:hypothetical protein